MPMAARVLAIALLVGVAGFCVFGFMATFEPGLGSGRLAWQALYAAAGCASLAAIVWLAAQRR